MNTLFTISSVLGIDYQFSLLQESTTLEQHFQTRISSDIAELNPTPTQSPKTQSSLSSSHKEPRMSQNIAKRVPTHLMVHNTVLSSDSTFKKGGHPSFLQLYNTKVQLQFVFRRL